MLLKQLGVPMDLTILYGGDIRLETEDRVEKSLLIRFWQC